MNSVQESKNELEAAIRYAENSISSAKQTIESMEFRQEMAQKNYQEQTGREQALEEQNNHLHKEVTRLENENKKLRSEKVATMPVIPKAVAIAIFREGIQTGVLSKCGDYYIIRSRTTEDAVIDSLRGLCADNKFECRIHGVDDQGEDSKNA